MRSDPTIWLANQFYTKCVGKIIPSTWFGVQVPPVTQLATPKRRLSLEIVSHCWQYPHTLVYQLSSLINHAAKDIDLTYTLFYATEDEGTTELTRVFGKMPTSVNWQFRALPKQQLFRRAIGRHLAAQTTSADWIWFADCDLVFHEDCLDSLATVLQGKQAPLVFPSGEHITEMLPPDHPVLSSSLSKDPPIEIEPAMFSPNRITKAKGAFQIVHGDVARTAGYCGTLKLYQRPDERWRKTYEDTVFRNLIGSQGEPVEVKNLYRVRHSAKGRYKDNSGLSDIRQKIRQATDTPNSSQPEKRANIDA